MTIAAPRHTAMGLKPWYPPDHTCDAEIKADPDIGGLGVWLSPNQNLVQKTLLIACRYCYLLL
jgi:hypothetical protein